MLRSNPCNHVVYLQSVGVSSTSYRYRRYKQSRQSSLKTETESTLRQAQDLATPARRVAVLMATFNGENYLIEQLESLAQQTWPRINVIVSDDRSTDRTQRQLARYASAWSKGSFEVTAGPGRGSGLDDPGFRLRCSHTRLFYPFCSFSCVLLIASWG